MAAKYTSFGIAAADDLACPICYQFYVTPHEPKNLQKCSHMCCSLCLKKMTEGGLKMVTCPQCNKVTNLPEGVDGLMTSLTVRNLAEKHPEGIKQRREQMQQQFDQHTYQTTEQMKESVETEKQIQTSIDDKVREIEQAVETMMTQAQDMIRQIKHLGQLKLTDTRQKIKQFDQQLNDIKQSKSKLKTMTDGEFKDQADALVNQIGKLNINKQTNRNEVYPAGKFVAQDIQLGRIVKTRILELVQKLATGSADGIASKPDRMLSVLNSFSNPAQVHIYKSNNDVYKKHFQFNIEQSKPYDVSDIAVSTNDKYLVAKRSGGIEVYSSDGKYQKKMKVTTDPNQKVNSLCIATTRDGRILVGSQVLGKGLVEEMEHIRGIVTVHDTAGDILRTIPTSMAPTLITEMCGTCEAPNFSRF